MSSGGQLLVVVQVRSRHPKRSVRETRTASRIRVVATYLIAHSSSSDDETTEPPRLTVLSIDEADCKESHFSELLDRSLSWAQGGILCFLQALLTYMT